MVDEPSVREELGRQIEARRREVQKTRQDIEREGDLASGTVSRFEGGTSLPTVESMIKLCGPLACRFVVSIAGVVLESI